MCMGVYVDEIIVIRMSRNCSQLFRQHIHPYTSTPIHTIKHTIYVG